MSLGNLEETKANNICNPSYQVPQPQNFTHEIITLRSFLAPKSKLVRASAVGHVYANY